MRPDFGCGLRRYLMEPNTPATRAAIGRDVERGARPWEPRIALDAVDVSPPTTRRGRAGRDRLRARARQQPRPAPVTVHAPGAVGGCALPPPDPRRPLLRAAARRAGRGASRSTRPSGPTTPSDPGITLLELFAFLGETLLFRFNQIPDQTRLWLLRLLQASRRAGPAGDGRGGVHADRAERADTRVRAGSTVTAGGVPFRVGNDVPCCRSPRRPSSRRRRPPPTRPARRVPSRARRRRADEEEARALRESCSLPTRRRRASSRSTSIHRRPPLWIAVHGANQRRRRRPPQLLGASSAARDPAAAPRLRRRRVPEWTRSTRATLGRPPERLGGLRRCSRVRLVGARGRAAGGVAGVTRPLWQVTSSGRRRGAGRLSGRRRATPRDSLRRNGTVWLRLPRDRCRPGGAAVDDPDLAGIGDLPPALDGRPVLFWLRAFPREGVPGRCPALGRDQRGGRRAEATAAPSYWESAPG